jgi:hypothetical protein
MAGTSRGRDLKLTTQVLKFHMIHPTCLAYLHLHQQRQDRRKHKTLVRNTCDKNPDGQSLKQLGAKSLRLLPYRI